MKMKWSLVAVAAIACLLPAQRPALGDDDERVRSTFEAVDAVLHPRNDADEARQPVPADASRKAALAEATTPARRAEPVTPPAPKAAQAEATNPAPKAEQADAAAPARKAAPADAATPAPKPAPAVATKRDAAPAEAATPQPKADAAEVKAPAPKAIPAEVTAPAPKAVQAEATNPAPKADQADAAAPARKAAPADATTPAPKPAPAVATKRDAAPAEATTPQPNLKPADATGPAPKAADTVATELPGDATPIDHGPETYAGHKAPAPTAVPADAATPQRKAAPADATAPARKASPAGATSPAPKADPAAGAITAAKGAAKAENATRSLSQKLINGKFYALVIGINSYKKINKLENAANDAQVVARVLAEDYGFDTKVLLEENATRDNIMIAINDLRKKLTEDDSFMIYYSGHGEFNKETGTSYWLPVDADFDDTTKWLDARSVSDQLKLLSARHVLVVADSCFSGTMTRSATTELKGNTTRESYLNKLFEKPSRVLIASGGNEPVSDGGAKDHSLFAAVLLKALLHPFDKVFTAEELMTRHLKESVAGRADQTPEYKVIRNSGHDGGDFIFVKRN